MRNKFIELFLKYESIDKLDMLYNKVIKSTAIETRIQYCDRLIDRLTFELKQKKMDNIKDKLILKKSAMKEIEKLSKRTE